MGNSSICAQTKAIFAMYP